MIHKPTLLTSESNTNVINITMIRRCITLTQKLKHVHAMFCCLLFTTINTIAKLLS